MYAAYFGLDENPFSITPDPRYLYLGHRHAEALAHLLYGIREGGGFIQLTGEVGTGKTTLTRSLLDELPDDVDVSLILNPRLDIDEFLAAICQELHIDTTAASSNRERVDALNRHLLDSHAAGRRTVLIIDEAQNLDADVLEQIRLLTNLETAKTKLLQILLIGQPELRETLARPELRQLAQRVTARYHLDPLDPAELADYIRHRLEVAGARAPLFHPRAVKRVWKHSQGIPRLANVICDRALLGAFTRDEREVTPTLVDRAAREVMGPHISPTTQAPAWTWPLLAAGLLAVAFVAWQAMPRAIVEPVAIASPVAEVTEEVPSFLHWLEDHADESGTDAALKVLFARWGVDYRPNGGPACEQASAAGLRCLYERGTWRSLQRLNRPAILSLLDDDGNAYQVVIDQASAESAHVIAGSVRRDVEAVALNRLWLGEFLALWDPPPMIDSALSIGAEGPGVIWLREQLSRVLGGDDLVVTNPRYDEALAERVREFQARERLRIDGIAGEQTLARLVALDSSSTAPRLREGS